MSQQAVLRNVDARGVATVTQPGLRAVVLRGAELQAAGERLVGQLLQNAPEANAQTKEVALEFALGRDRRRGARAIVRAACRQAPQRRGDGGARVVR